MLIHIIYGGEKGRDLFKIIIKTIIFNIFWKSLKPIFC